jgi:sugar lactone lactonase YvrE
MLTAVAFFVALGHFATAQAPAAFPGSTSVGQTSSPLTVSVAITGNGVAVAPRAVTQGIAGADFALATGGTCAAGSSYFAGQTCTVVVTFKPKSPGVRSGAVVLQASDGSLLGSTLLAGAGQGSLAVLQPGQIDTVVGDGAWTYRGDGVLATMAPIFLPTAVAVDAGGNIFLSDSSNNRVRRVDAVSGLISTVAGNGIPGFSGDGGPATQASISVPAGLVVDGAGNLFFADTDNNVVRRVDAVTGFINTVVGIGGVQGYNGDGGAASAANLSLPEGLAFDAAGNLYIADTGNDAVRVVDAVTGKIRTIAGTGVAGYNGDGILATAAKLNQPWNIAVGLDGSILIADLNNNRVRKVDSAGMISTVVGTGVQAFDGDGGSATSARLNAPAAVVLDPAGNMYIADSGNNRVRKVSAATGIISTITGTGSETFGGDTGPAHLAGLYGPYALFFDNVTGNLLVADMFHNRVRRISGTTIALQYATIRVSKTSPPQAEGLENDGNADLTNLTPVLVNAALDPATTTCNAGPLTSDASCNFGVEFAPTVVGNLVLGSVTLNSNAGNSPDIISLSGEVLTVEPTAVTLTSSENPSLLSDAVTFTATVSSADKSRSGPVTFLDGTTVICNAVPLTAAGTATCATSTLTLGQHSITANYAGDTNNASAISTPLLQVVQQQVSLALLATPNPAVVGASVTLTVAATAVTGVPTGTVTFYDGTAAIGSANLAAGAASFSTTQLSVGTHNLTAKYAGDATDAAGVSNAVSEVINEGNTVTTLATSNANVNYGVPVTLTATVSSTNGPTPTGKVQFMDGSTVLGTGTVGSTGVATLTLSTLAPGSHSIVASYQGDGSDSASNSAPLVEVVQEIATTTALSANVSSASAGTAVQLTAKVAAATGATADGAVTGQVTFSYGSTVLGSAAVNASGVATLSVTTLPVGSDSITASYAGDSSYIASASSPMVELITQASMTLTLAGPATVNVGTQAVFTVLLTAPGPAPTAVLTLRDGGAVVGTQAVTAPGTFTFTTSSLALGTHTLTASYAGDANYGTTASNAITVVVQQGAATTSLQSSLNPQIVGQSVTLTATVTSVSPNVTGTISFTDGSASLGSAPVNAAGVATFTLSTLAFGSHNLTAVYSGDANHAGSTSPVLTQKIVEPATVALGSSVNPATAGVSIVFTAKLTGTTTLTPTGVVKFLDGATVVGTGNLDATGAATFSTNSLTVGSHSITASYAGDSNFSTATSSVLIETVQSASTQIALSASANPAIYGTPLTLTAAITTNGAVATGSVTFTEAGTTIGTTLLNGSGVATLTLSTLAPGAHNIVANYGGDSQTSASTSTPLALSVKEVTAVSIVSSANPALTLSSIVLTATVTNSGVGVPTGTITFVDGTTQLGTATLDAQGHATFTVASLSAGNHAIVANYAGDSMNFTASSEGFAQSVQLRPTTTALTATATDPTNPQEVTLIAVVRWTGTTTPTGKITFTNGGATVGSVAVDATGVATMNIIVSSGTESIVATYSGDTSYAGSASPVTSVTSGAATQFTMQVNPAAMTVQSKQHVTVDISMASVKGFTDTMEFGCLGLPFAATCTFSKTQMVLQADGTQTLQLTIDTGNPLGAGAQASNARPGSGALLAFLPGTLLIGFVLMRKKRTLPMLTVLVLMLGMGAMLSATGCAGLQESGTPAGTYSFKVSATGAQTGANASQTMTLTVTQ